ncbi:MAG: hypothetical protein LBE32_05740 [Burkholderiales bacterium]|jgi:Tfp pilus assembly protein PilX|nr:hypothetical protein [Burkholderiales bacterium]
MANPLAHKHCSRPFGSTHQRGVILFITLIIMVLMSLACVTLMRSVDMAVIAVGNLAFRQAAQAPAFWAIDDSLVFLETADTSANSPPQGYYASLQESNSTGIPVFLTASPPENAKILIDRAGNTIYYLIERMCLHDGSPDTSHCLSGMLPDETIAGLSRSDFPAALYRITVRVNGPRHTTIYMQAVVRHVEPPFIGVLKNRRLNTRFIDF